MYENLTLVLAQTDSRPDAGTAPTPAPATGDNTATGTNQSTTTGQDGSTQGQDGQPAPPPPGGFGGMGLPALLLVFLVVMFGMTFLSHRKEKKKRANMLSELKKNDRIVTIGGIIGTIVEVKDNEIVVKVDESSNTRMRFSRNAIQGVAGDEITDSK